MTTPMYTPPLTSPPMPSVPPARYPPAPNPPRSGLRLGVVALVVVVAIAMLETTLPASAAMARRNSFPQPHITVSTSASSSSRVGDPLQFSVVAQAGRELTYDWQFGDGGTGSGQTVTHTFGAYQNGGYSVLVFASDPLHQSASAEVNVTVLPLPPQACFSATADQNYVITEDFDASCSSGTELSYQWNYGDGNTDQGPQVSHQYGQPGNYNVTLTVIDVANQQASVTHAVRVTVAPPIARFTATEDSFYGCYFTFDASSSSGYNIGTFNWNFGDGQTESDYSSFTSHYYPYSANFTVSLTVVDQFGQTGSTSQTINVSGC